MSLIAAELERRGIPTVVIQLLKYVTERVRPPRALFVPFPHGYPLAAPGDPAAQRAVLDAALGVFEEDAERGPVLVDYRP